MFMAADCHALRHFADQCSADALQSIFSFVEDSDGGIAHAAVDSLTSCRFPRVSYDVAEAVTIYINSSMDSMHENRVGLIIATAIVLRDSLDRPQSLGYWERHLALFVECVRMGDLIDIMMGVALLEVLRQTFVAGILHYESGTPDPSLEGLHAALAILTLHTADTLGRSVTRDREWLRSDMASRGRSGDQVNKLEWCIRPDSAPPDAMKMWDQLRAVANQIIERAPTLLRVAKDTLS